MARISDHTSAYVHMRMAHCMRFVFSLPAIRERCCARPVADCSTKGSRYIYDLYYEKEAISRKLYDWLLKNGYADGNLIAKWKKQGYEKVSRRDGESVY